MKSIIFIIIIAFPLDIICQLEFAPVGAKWTYEKKSWDWMTANVYYSMFVIESEKDTMILDKLFKKLSGYNLDINAIGEKVRIDRKPQFIHQNEYIISHLIEDSIVKTFDFNPAIGEKFYYLGWNIFIDRINLSPLEYKILDKFRDSTYSFLPNKIQAEITCSVSEGKQMVIYEKFGYLSDILFYSDKYCITDQTGSFTLRCYEDPMVDLIKFDSIDCDSIRPDIIRTTNFETKDADVVIYHQKDLNQLVLINKSGEFIKEVFMFDLTGKLLVSKKINSLNMNHLITTNDMSSGLYVIMWKYLNGNLSSQKYIID